MKEQKNQSNGAQAPRGESNPGSVGPISGDSEGHVHGWNNAAPKAKQPISAKKLASNRANAQHSTGPKTAAGKAHSSSNSYKHGLCAQHLVRPGPEGARDQEAYQKLASRVWNHYQPEGIIEEFLVEKIVTEMVRYARIIGHEQRFLGHERGFDYFQPAMILRYSTTSDRQLMRSIKEIDRLQMERAMVSGLSDRAVAEDSDSPAPQGEPTDDADWSCLSALRSGPKPTGERGGGAKIPVPLQANRQTGLAGSDSGDKSPAEETAPVQKKYSLADPITEICNLPPMPAQDIESDPTRNCETNPPSRGSSNGGATKKE
jgi:hypothetical protein